MDRSFDSNPKETPKVSPGQLPFFSEEVARGEQDLIAEDDANSATQPESHQCAYCPESVSPDDPSTCHEITSWVRGIKKDSPVLRRYTTRLAHGACIDKIRAGHAPDQPDLETLLGAKPSDTMVGSLFTDATDAYTTGYNHGRTGTAPIHPFLEIDKNDYELGYAAGSAEREVESFDLGNKPT